MDGVRDDLLRRERFARDAAVFVPKRVAVEAGGSLAGFMAEVNDIVATRGMVLADGQVIDKPFSDRIGYELYGDSSAYDDVHGASKRRWGNAQREFFGLSNPHQMAEESEGYLCWHVMAYVLGPFLAEGEMIIGLVDGIADCAEFVCECRDAAVVYTNRARVVCMSCGYMHVMLDAPLDLVVRDVLTGDDYFELFDFDGSRRHDEVDLATVEFRDIENAHKTWQTCRWEQSVQEFVLFARTPREELRGTQFDGSLLAQDGFEPHALPRSPIWELDAASIDLDLIGNAESAFRAGVAAYNTAYRRQEGLTTAIQELDRAIELLLKARLDQLDPKALDKRYYHRALLQRLVDHGALIVADSARIGELHRERNSVQHGTVRLNLRAGLGLSRDAIIFIDAFSASQLGLRTKDALTLEDWRELLRIPEIAASARVAAAETIEACRREHEASVVEECPHCGENAQLWSGSGGIASCVYCGYVDIGD
jgi:hypothetical protein